MYVHMRLLEHLVSAAGIALRLLHIALQCPHHLNHSRLPLIGYPARLLNFEMIITSTSGSSSDSGSALASAAAATAVAAAAAACCCCYRRAFCAFLRRFLFAALISGRNSWTSSSCPLRSAVSSAVSPPLLCRVVLQPAETSSRAQFE